jgi:hypothetical protein
MKLRNSIDHREWHALAIGWQIASPRPWTPSTSCTEMFWSTPVEAQRRMPRTARHLSLAVHLVPGIAIVFGVLVQPASASELNAWREAETSGSCDALRAFLDRYPDKILAPLARKRLNDCESEEPAMQPHADEQDPLKPPSVVPNPPPSSASPSRDNRIDALGRSTEIPVAALQAALHALNYDPGPADGRIGPRTKSAIRAFQRDQGQAATGKLSTRQRVELVRRAAAAGHADSQFQLGCMAADGIGILRDLDAARLWLKRAVRQDHRDALSRLRTLDSGWP